MKTALFISTFMHGKDPYSTRTRMDRIFKHLDYYSRRIDELGVDQIYVSDNGGNADQVRRLLWEFPSIELIRHPYLARGEHTHVYDYLPCWRALYDVKKVIGDGFTKIITMDDDAYVLSGLLMDYIKYIGSGWTALWCPTFNFPESAMSVLCEDAFPIFHEFTSEPYERKNKSIEPFEKIIPYTRVEKNWNCDRWGENRILQRPGMDAYFQCPVDIPMTSWK